MALRRGDAAEHLAHRFLLVELGDVAPDRRRRDMQDVEQILHRREGALLQRVEDQAVALAFFHDASRDRL